MWGNWTICGKIKRKGVRDEDWTEVEFKEPGQLENRGECRQATRMLMSNLLCEVTGVGLCFLCL